MEDCQQYLRPRLQSKANQNYLIKKSPFRKKVIFKCNIRCFEIRKENIKKTFEKAKFNIMGSKSNLNLVQVKDILDAHENT